MHEKEMLDSETKETEINQICDVVRECSFALHKHLRHGHLEKIYENGLMNRLMKKNVSVVQQAPVPVYDEDQTLLGNLYADLFVENKLIVELKAVRNVNDDHSAQLIGYLRSSRVRFGLLINFGNPKLYVKRYVLDPL